MYTETDLISFAAYRARYSDWQSETYKNMGEALNDWKQIRASESAAAAKHVVKPQ